MALGRAAAALSRCFLWALTVCAMSTAGPLSFVTKPEAAAPWVSCLHLCDPPRLAAPTNSVFPSLALFCQWPVTQAHNLGGLWLRFP